MSNQSRQQSRQEHSQSEAFLKIGVPKKEAKYLKNTSKQVHVLVDLQAAGLQFPKIWKIFTGVFQNFAKLLNSWTALYFEGTSPGGCFCSYEQTQRNHSDQKQKSFTSTTHLMCVVVMKIDKKNYFQSVRLHRLLELTNQQISLEYN